ncbi:ribosomal protein S7 [Punctularia strigosozonata HHB-11173 SS5]|uniref:ribosomal protein S7 n=1 Tax=Punctularia strigosozonata (strain HHB-11173) TaxID=741275 RepID=UPI00044173AA|nr:ribosomal protein S7 [Punctularia strigosozonata HHB-11173 SS5]EIN08139.1 ribosomal protein S7 [Punctularia strigosozonata HHB-11173 SS5]
MLAALRPAASKAALAAACRRAVSTLPTSPDAPVNLGAYIESLPPKSEERPAFTRATREKHEWLNIPPAEDPLLHFLTNLIMKHGERAKAARATSSILLWIHTFTRAPPLPILRQAVLNASPAVRVKSIKVGGKTVHTPVALSERQRTHYGLKWMLKGSDHRPGMYVGERFAREVIAVLQGDSTALAKKLEIHKTAMTNRGKKT